MAPLLLGWRIRTESRGEVTEVEISEVEAYGSSEDRASHSFGGPTPRNRPMYEAPGTLYVYLNYGMHFLMNVVVGPVGTPQAVLLRGGIPKEGIDIMRRRRGRPVHTTDGPGKLTQALGVTLEHNNTSLVTGPVRLLPPPDARRRTYASSRRIGISKATNFPWRFVSSEDSKPPSVGPVS